ncbi:MULTISPECIES: aldehyde dehydrogenase family protein [Pseudofrankia]|uniref:aldehyde dehydrogenase family protein n=1 Tax=Pseudofrankia TaxID=2994363 RepID=UPI000234DB3D|nr:MULTISPECIES: aldehyde dehydrogenase family protein [Pseudofrankia]OHV30881.1 aldehyde dehydrogenase [Pseudofrankia sp. EUN1h]
MATVTESKLSVGETSLYIDGELRGAAGGRTYDNISPWTGEVVGKSADASAEDVGDAVSAARRAFDTTDWSTNHAKRLELVTKLYDLFRANTDRLVQIARDEAGSTLFIARNVQILQSLAGYQDLIDAFAKVRWTEDRGRRGPEGRVSHRIQMREAAGVVGAITPFNVPFYVNIEKVVSALLSGCTVVLKPAPDTPALGAIWGEMAAEAGFPAGVLNVVTGSDPALGELLVTDPRVDLIAFTGSSAVGKRIMEKGASTLKRVLLELGGKSAKIILDDVEDFAGEVASSVIAGHSGQGCTVRSRLLVPRNRYAEAIEILKSTYAAYDGKWGHYDDPRDPMGPVISRRQMERIKAYIDVGLQEGATLIAGGRIGAAKRGFFIEPTCFADVTNDMAIAREEIFGPVLVVMPYEDEDDAVRIANDSEYGLSGEVSSGSIERAIKLAARFRSGTVSINGGRCVDGDIPFGGYKSSGLGRSWGVEGIEEYTETKIVSYLVPGVSAGA